MPSPLSQNIRRRFQLLHKEGHSAREIGRRLLISAATAVRYSDNLRQGHDLTPALNSRRCGMVVWFGTVALISVLGQFCPFEVKHAT